VTWRVEIDDAAERDFAELPPNVQERVISAVHGLQREPLPSNSAALAGNLQGLRRLRFGDYRLVYRLEPAARSVTVLAIADRRHIYHVLERRLG
jgi:mRNA interferase RelE/StbE